MKRLERECAKVASQAQKRLDESIQLRKECQSTRMPGSPVSASAKETLWMSRERAKAAVLSDPE